MRVEVDAAQPLERGVRGDQALVDLVGGDLQRRPRRALRASGSAAGTARPPARSARTPARRRTPPPAAGTPARSRRAAPGAIAASSPSPRTVWRPATTSSPCASSRKSMYRRRSPSAGSRVKPTPAPETPPALPNTIRCRITAVPSVVGDLVQRGGTRAPSARPTTRAPLRRRAASCSIGSCGNGRRSAPRSARGGPR